jgi:hypothetical protein
LSKVGLAGKTQRGTVRPCGCSGLVTDDAETVTGIVLLVDGGESAY